jgi:hypothetical protein
MPGWPVRVFISRAGSCFHATIATNIIRPMGAWGTGIFDDDLAADMRLEWSHSVAAGGSPADATAALIDGLGTDVRDDPDDGPVFWIALAALQVEAGALDEGVASQARDSFPPNLARWRNESTPEDAAERERVLGELNERLRT